jgi:hypothetical protein
MNQPAEEPTVTKRRAVQRFWFSGLTPEEQELILHPHFEGAHPKQEDKKRAAQEYDEW